MDLLLFLKIEILCWRIMTPSLRGGSISLGYFTVKGCIAEKRMQADLSTPVFKKSGRLSNFDEIALNYYT
ncbi:hypothetical protein D6219_08045 [Coxiella burnetii]|nr:hypothetical protein AYM00_07550 [Coxiella burnetii]AZV75734.1 hypothetical protein D6219_08045 [Coxiella burnetii]PNT87352.1 hypothetical protein C2L93_00500 [Coxiella burnetii]